MININHPAGIPHPGSQETGETKREKWAAQFMAAHLATFVDNFPNDEALERIAKESLKAAEALKKALNAQEGEGK